ncbi:MAG: tetratricopeptide repeat protein, partial [Calditrichaeota bacterium]
LKTNDAITAKYLALFRQQSGQIVNRISNARPEDFNTVGFIDVVQPIYDEYAPQVFRISISDSTGRIQFSTYLEEFDTPFSRPKKLKSLDVGLYRYMLDANQDVYELESPLVIKSSGKVYGTVHVYFPADLPATEIRDIRMNYLQMAVFVLGMSYIGVALLIYLVMNPFRKLADWVRNLGHGEIEDEIDIDRSGEIGEIARAFTDITHKFRESQKNLADQERLHKEMQLAQEIQQTLLPMEFPELEGYEISAYYEAAKEVGGDYYDFVEVDKDTLGVAVADVSGKGVPGSLVMTMIRTALRTEARGLKDAAEVLARVNEFVSSDIKKGMFVTVFYLIIDSKKRRLNYASAGHNPMILYRGNKQKTYYLNPKGFPIGVQLPGKDQFRSYIESDTIQLAKDDILLLYTDGITEAMNSKRELFGEERLLKVLRDYGHLGAEQFVEKLKDSIYSFTEGCAQYDDITLVAVKEKSTRELDELRRAKEAHQMILEGKSVREACEEVNLTTYAYYNKYKRVFEEEGVDAFEVDETVSVEAKHLSIEEKTKIFDIIAHHPEYGAGRIREELNTEKYDFTDISESRIYEELVRNRLNTRQLREAYVERAKRGKRRMKPPGTPLMTLDGKVIIQKPEGQRPLSPRPPLPREEPEERRRPPQAAGMAFDRGGEQKGEELEAEALLEAPLEDVLSEETQEEDDWLFGEETVTEESETTDAEEMEEAGTHASVSELVSQGDEASDEIMEFDDIPSTTEKASEEAEEQTVPSEDELDFEVLTTEMDLPAVARELETEAGEEDVDFGSTPDETEFEDEPQAVKESTEKGPKPLEDVEEDGVSQEEGHDELTVSSVSELLATAPEEDDEFDEEEAQELVGSEENNRADGIQESVETDGVSFSDLIQAIDDEIVYVTDFASENREPGPSQPISAQPEVQAEVEPGEESNNNNLSVEGESAVEEESKEMILIKGIKYYKNNEYDQAIQAFKRVIAIYPDYKEAHSLLGNAYFRNKMYEEAAIEYETVKQIDPDDVTAYENMGVIYANRGRYKQAVGEWKRVLELDPEREDIKEKIKKALRLI